MAIPSFRRLVWATGVGSAAAALAYKARTYTAQQQQQQQVMFAEIDQGAGAVRKGLPEYTEEEVAKHSSLQDGCGVWVTYKAGVYDITSFVQNHPGGEKRIMLAAGSGIDKWWQIFTIHDEDAVREILEQHRIGNLKGYVPKVIDTNAMWANEPKRSPSMHVLSSQPYSAQSPEGILTEFITPNELFFVRGHMPVPVIGDEYCLQVDGDGIKPHCFSMDELKSNFAQHTITVTIQCGGNRRSEMTEKYKDKGGTVKGLAWDGGALGNAEWTGVWLRDVIEAQQKEAPVASQSYHVQFEGADSDAAGHFNVSIPYRMAMDRDADVLLAFKMNGVCLPRDHGYPLRAVVPGVVGVRNCKWLQRVTVQPHEARSVWQQNDYKNYPSWETKPDPKYPSTYYMPVQSRITEAKYDVNEDAVALKAYAYCGGGRAIQRVEVSFDGGETFEKEATILPLPPGPASLQEGVSGKAWAWRQIASSTPLEDITAEPQQSEDGHQMYRTCIRAINEDNAIQPVVSSYNFRGLLYNGYSCRDVVVEE